MIVHYPISSVQRNLFEKCELTLLTLIVFRIADLESVYSYQFQLLELYSSISMIFHCHHCHTDITAVQKQHTTQSSLTPWNLDFIQTIGLAL